MYQLSIPRKIAFVYGGSDHMVVRFTTTCATSAYHH